MGDGDGWTHCARGHRHWGLFGAAGLLLTDGGRVLLQHRAPWTHEGDTWGVPGGARDSHENALSAALREATEETSLDPRTVTAEGHFVDDHGGWAYTTILGRSSDGAPVHAANAESVTVQWWPLAQVETLPLHRGFAASWPHLRDLLPRPER